MVDYIRPVSANATPEQLTKIATVYEKALTRGANSYEIFRTLAEVYVKLGRSSDAEAIYLRALKTNLKQSKHGHALRSLCQLYTNRNAVNELIILLGELRPIMKAKVLFFLNYWVMLI